MTRCSFFLLYTTFPLFGDKLAHFEEACNKF